MPIRRSFSRFDWFFFDGTVLSAKIQLVVNADDFGFTRDVNEGIVEAHRRGILTATTLMANGVAFEHAVALARETPTLDVGCHLVMVQGQSVLHPERAMPRTLQELIPALWRGEVRPYEEARAQVRKILDAGIRLTHIDTHKHTHILPPVLDAVSRVAREFGIRWVRRPFDFHLDPGATLKKRAVTLGLRALQPPFRKALAGLGATDHFAGFQHTGRLNTATLCEILEKLPMGTTELMCHPGLLGSELQAAATRLKQSRATELEALTAAEPQAVIARRGICLTTYREL